MVPRRSAVQFILTKLIACYLAVMAIVLSVFIVWSYHHVEQHRDNIATQLKSSVEAALRQSPDDVSKALEWLAIGTNLSQSEKVPLQAIAILSEEGHVLFAWPDAQQVADTNSLTFNVLNLKDSPFTLAIAFSETLLENVFTQDLWLFVVVFLCQLALLLILMKYLVRRGISRAFSSFMRELSLVNLRHPSPLQADSFLGQFGEYRQVLAGVNRVVLSLAKSRGELTEINLGLEKHIQEKTASLAERNEELLILNKQLSIIANTDSLTQVYNRTRFDVLFKEHVEHAKRRSTPLSILLVDLDDFKKVNDRFGHQAGDQVLKHAAQLIQTVVGEDGVVARWGGEEFAVLLPYFDLTKAEAKAESLRASVAKARFEEQEIKVTTSIGMAQLNQFETASQLLKRADDALYDAKGSGRNRVIIAYYEQNPTQLDLADGEFIEVFDAVSEPSQCVPEVSQKLPS